MNNISDSSKTRKRQRAEDIDAESSRADPTLSLGENLTFSDTLVALRIIRAQFPHIDKASIQPFILKSQLYSSVEDRTQVDRELESLRREKVLRVFKLNTGQDDHAIMFLEDYLNQMERVVKRIKEKKRGDVEVFEWFREHVIDSKLEPSIEHQELYSLLSLGGKVKDEHMSLLINAGLLWLEFDPCYIHKWIRGKYRSFLGEYMEYCHPTSIPNVPHTRQLIDPNMYWFAIPNIGSVLKGLSQEVTSKAPMVLGIGKKGTSFFTKPQRIQRDDVGPSREEATSILSTGYEISPS
ncbi:hypothetical protein Patl1_01761 [Pistacia atlantica]|uniref:Uncharacterized protein n=1 Tax=Pistacia atlantica TaxID=434234 RepID=A0ACC1CD04_9ROSI|nr:hypothetical protein Patl1_01761 [Pistacia atlantica]